MFGKVQDVPQRETTLLWPRSPYGVAKVYGHYMTINYRESYGMHASSGILFNHESPRRGPEFVTRKITQAVARISLGLQESISLGNLDAQAGLGLRRRLRRGDVADAAAGPRPTTTSSPPGRRTRSASSSTIAFAHVGIDDWQPKVDQDPRFLRPAEVDLLIGDPTKARKQLGWQPKVGFEDLVRMMVDSDLAEQRKLNGR